MKIYKYPNSVPHVHDSIEGYENVVPFSEKGLHDHCEIVHNPAEADFFYMGQWSNDYKLFNISNYPYFEQNKERHIVDLEGDGGFDIPEYLWDSIVTVNGPYLKYDSKIKNLFVRPTFSTLFVDMSKNRFEPVEPCLERSVGFKGFINCQTRYNMYIQLTQFNNGIIDAEVEANPIWNGPSTVGSEIQEDYVRRLKKHAFTLCPRGAGVDSVRLLEACYYGRIPILISDEDYLLVDHKYADTSFVKKVIWDGKSNLASILKEIVSVDDSQVEEDQRKAKEYFEDTLRIYMDNPTQYMIDWMQKQRLTR